MDEKRISFFEFLDRRTAEVLAQANALVKEDRKDEGNVLKARANVYGIFKAIWNASEKSAAGNSFVQDLALRIERITSPWGQSMETARQHDDAGRMMVEEAKLAAVREVNEKLASLWN